MQEIMHVKSESDVTSLAAAAPPRSPKREAYDVQSPSHDDKSSSSMQPTPVSNSPVESPSHASSASHSPAKSKHRRGANFKAATNENGRSQRNVTMEEGSYGNLHGGDREIPRRCQAVLAGVALALLFATVCLIVWGLSRSYKPRFLVKSMSVSNFYLGEGSGSTGAPTKMITLNCSVKLSIYNPASTYGIHVTSGPVALMYSHMTIATGQLPKHYQPRKSYRTVSMIVQGEKVPLHGAGAAGLPLSSTGGAVPLTLDFDIYSRASVVGKLVRVKHQKHVSCPLTIDTTNTTKPIKFSQNSCTYHD